MKLSAPYIAGCLLLSALPMGCDGSNSEHEIARPATSKPRPSALDAKPLRDVSARADAAFAQIKPSRSRFGSRIGPQPWPRDLPARWPRPDRARVVADSNGRGEGRLLLIDLPESPDQEFSAMRDVLLENGFTVIRPGPDKTQRSLQVQGREVKAQLRFHSRAPRPGTRLEILFLSEIRTAEHRPRRLGSAARQKTRYGRD